MSNIRRSMMAASRSGSAIDWESIARGMMDNITEFDIPDIGLTTFNEYQFFKKKGLKRLILPDSVLSIGTFCFSDSGLESVYLHKNVTVNGQRTFNNCYSLTNVVFQEGTTKLVDSMFNSCTSLASITLPTSIETLGAYAFYNTRLVSIVIPPNVTSIGNNCFQLNYQLKEVIVEPTTPPTFGTNVFNGCPALAAIYVPDASVSAYQAANNWSTYASIIKGISERPTT